MENILGIFKKKIHHSKSLAPETSTKRMIKSLRNLLKEASGTKQIKQKIVDFLKTNIKEKGYKSDTKSYFLTIAKTYYEMTSSILLSNEKIFHDCTNEHVISFAISFYDFYEDELSISNQDIMAKINREDLEESYFMTLVACLNYAKLCECLEFIQEKNNEMEDIAVKTMNLIYLFIKINKYVESNSDVLQNPKYSVPLLVRKVTRSVLPNLIAFFTDLLDSPDMKTIFSFVETEDLGRYFNDLSKLRPLRLNMYDIFSKINTSTKDGIKIMKFKKFVTDNNCLEGLLTSIKDSYNMNDYSDVGEIFKEIINILIIQRAFFESRYEFKDQIFFFVLKIVEDFCFTTDNYEEFDNVFRLFIEDIFNLSYVDREDIKNKICEKTIEKINTSDLISNNGHMYKNLEMIELLLSVFDNPIETEQQLAMENFNHIRKIILNVILDHDITLLKYRMIICQTTFCDKVLSKMHILNEELISSYFSVLLILSEGMNFSTAAENQINQTSEAPIKEMKAIIESLLKCEKEITLTIILKYFKTFLDLSPGFQRMIVNCGIFSIIFEILDCTLEYLEQNSQPSSNRGYESSRYSEFPVTNRRGMTQLSECPVIKTLSYLDNKKQISPTIHYSPEMIIKLLNFIELLLINCPENVSILKNYQIHDNYFTRFTNFDKYKLISYKIWSICMIYETEQNDTKKYVKSILQRYYILKDYLQNIACADDYKIIIDEIMKINEMIALRLLKENSINSLICSNNQILIKEIILDFVNLFEIYRPQTTQGENNGNLFESSNADNNENTLMILDEELKAQDNQEVLYVWDAKMQSLIKIYLQTIFDLIEHYNKSLFNNKFKRIKSKHKNNQLIIQTLIKKDHLKSIIEKIMKLLKTKTEDSYLTDFINFLIEKSFKFKSHDDRHHNPHNKLDKKGSQLFPNDSFALFYKDKFKINDTFLNNSCTSVANHSNFTIQSPMIMKYILKCLTSTNSLSQLTNILEFVEFLCKVSENNIKLLLNKDLIKLLLYVYNNNTEIMNKMMDIVEITSKYFSKNDLVTIFNFLLSSISSKTSPIFNRLMKILYKSFKISRKICKHVTLSSVNTRQPNIYNMLFTGNIHFANNVNNILKFKVSYLSVFITLKFHKDIESTSNFILFKLERDNKEKEISVLEVGIEKTNLVIRENDQEIFSSNELTKHIRLDKNTHFILIISKETNELQIYVNRKLLCVTRPELKYLDLNAPISYNLITGYSGANCREVYQDSFETFPYVSLSYYMIYADKITTENIEQFGLSHVWNSKNGSVIMNECKLKHLSEKNYKTFAPTQSNDKKEFLNLKLNFESCKVVYEFIADKVGLKSNNSMEQLKCYPFILNNFMYKLQRKYHFEILEKDFLVYVPNTNYNNIGENNYEIYNHTFLLSKYNIAESLYLNTIYDAGKIRFKILSDAIGIELGNIFDANTRSFEYLSYLMMLLNEVSNILEPSLRSSGFYFTLKLMCLYLVSNLNELVDFPDSELFKVLLITLYKNSEIITNDVVDLFFNLSFGLEDRSKSNTFNPWYIRFITDVLLDINLFQILPMNVKIYIVNTIKSLNNKEVVLINESDYESKVSILIKLYKIILLTDNKIDDDLIHLVTLILDQMLKYKKGACEPTEESLKSVVYATLEFLRVSENFSQPISAHLMKRNFNEEETDTTSYILKKIFPKLYSDSLHSIRNTLVNFFTKLAEHHHEKNNIQQRRNSSLMTFMKIHSILQPIFTLINCIDTSTMINNFSPMFKPRKSEIIEAQRSGTRTISRHNSLMQVNLGGGLKLGSKDSWLIVNSTNIPNNKKKTKDDYNVMTDLKKTNYFEREVDFDSDCNGENCLICNFILSSMDISFEIIRKFLIYKKFIKRFFYATFLKHLNMEEYMSQKGINFSWNVFNREGPARIKKKFVAKIDSISNDEMVKKYYDEAKMEKIFNFDNIAKFERYFDFFDTKHFINNLIYNDQIFRLNYVYRVVESDDVCEMAFNCLLFKGMNETNCVLVIGEKRFYILKNLHIDKENSLLDCKFKFNKFFWAINNYEDEWERVCPYLNGYTVPRRNDNIDPNDDEQTKSAKKYKKLIKSICSRKHLEMTKKFTRSRNEFKILTFSFKEINEMHKRKFLHQNNAIEIFTKTGKNFLFAFNVDKRDMIYKTFIQKIQQYVQAKASRTTAQFTPDNSILNSNHCIYMNNSIILMKKEGGKLQNQKRELIDSKVFLKDIQEKWVKGIVSNYDYLMILNTLGGRSYNDLSQYPVFPWIIKDYTTDGINLNDDSIYRNLSYPIYALEKNSREALKLKYEGAEGEGRYHSGTHYSNPGFTSYYLIRLKPFANIAAEIQGGYFDTSDRLFFNIKSLWDVSDKYQELIPEMYYLPEALVNFNEFNFGVSQSQINVKDVLLPEWARKDPRLFVKMIKKAMESFRVSEKISDWIDLIFGYKQQGVEAVNNLNVFRDVCYPFDPNNYVVQLMKDYNEDKVNAGSENISTMVHSAYFNERVYEDLEIKMTEICDMGQNPIQIFTKPHLKKDRHPKSKALFSRCAYLMNIKKKEKEFKVKIDTKPTQIKGYYESSESYLSHGEGGLSSFRMYCDEDERNPKNFDAFNTFFIVGGKKVLLGPKFKNYIDYGITKYSLTIVKPYSKVSFEFPTFRDSPINEVKATNNGKLIMVGFQDGTLVLYKLKKVHDRVCHPDFEKRKEKGLFSKMFSNKKDSVLVTRASTVLETQSTLKLRETMVSNRPQQDIPANELFITKLNFVTNEDLRDYYCHNNTQNKYSNNKDAWKGTTYFTMHPINSSSLIRNPIKFIELLETYSLMIVVDTMNYIYLYDMNKLQLMRQMNFPEIMKTKQEIKYVCICDLTGDFVVITSYLVALFNVNGVLLGDLNLKDNNIYKIGKITAATVKSLKNTESDIHLFTGHEDGALIMWKVENKYIPDENTGYLNTTTLPSYGKEENYLDSYRFAYNTKYYKEQVNKNFELKLQFNIHLKIEEKRLQIRLVKLVEDMSSIMVIYEDNSLLYFSYEDYIDKKKNPKVKICPQCNSQLGSSKIECVLCKKKLCGLCKIERKIPQISFKVAKPICEDCFKMSSSTNKMLYDF